MSCAAAECSSTAASTSACTRARSKRSAASCAPMCSADCESAERGVNGLQWKALPLRGALADSCIEQQQKQVPRRSTTVTDSALVGLAHSLTTRTLRPHGSLPALDHRLKPEPKPEWKGQPLQTNAKYGLTRPKCGLTRPKSGLTRPKCGLTCRLHLVRADRIPSDSVGVRVQCSEIGIGPRVFELHRCCMEAQLLQPKTPLTPHGHGSHFLAARTQRFEPSLAPSHASRPTHRRASGARSRPAGASRPPARPTLLRRSTRSTRYSRRRAPNPIRADRMRRSGRQLGRLNL